MNLPTQIEYECLADLNLYDSPQCDRLATQAAKTRHLRIISHPQNPDPTPHQPLQVCLCEDDYPGWLAPQDITKLTPATAPYQPPTVPAPEIAKLIPTVIKFTQAAMQQPNHYLWGGTVAPNYDCSGLMQAAFASVGIWLPRDAYQQEAFTMAVDITALQPGDLIFFGTPQKATHVGLYVGEECYIHSSGIEIGRNGIGIDRLSEHGDEVSKSYYQQLRGAGRVVNSYIAPHK